MSLVATRWAWSLRGLRPAQKLVLLSLADRAGEDGVCWPSIPRLARDTGLNEKTVRAAILNTRWPGRFQQISDHPVIIVDGAHNAAGIESLVAALRHHNTGNVGLVCGFLAVFALPRQLISFTAGALYGAGQGAGRHGPG